MIQLVQFPWSPFCLVQQRILEYGRIPYKLVSIPPSDRSLVWRWTKQRYYQVPILKDGRQVLFETGPDSQVLSKYLDNKHQLGLFPRSLDGVQAIVWRHIENEVEDMTFRLNDAHFREFIPANQQCAYLRHKERKFGVGCLDTWLRQSRSLQTELARRLLPYEQMVRDQPFLLGARPCFVDFDLWGMLANYLYSGHYHLPAAHGRLRSWYDRLGSLSLKPAS